MTHRERLENKLEKRLDWAEGREQKAASLLRRNEPFRGDIAFNTQPGHIPERARCIQRSEKAYEHQNMADHHQTCAAGIERQLDKSVFSDDNNAIEALTARIAEREAEAGRIKAYNKACRAAKKAGRGVDMSMLSEAQKADIVNIAKVCFYQLGADGQFPGYKLTNINGRINADRKRIEEIKHRQTITAEAAQSETGYIIKGEDYINIMFAEKPDREIINALKASGFCWAGGCWCGYRDKLPAILNASNEPQTLTATA